MFITGTLLLSEFYPPPAFHPEEVTSTLQSRRDLPTVSFIVNRALTTSSEELSTGTTTLLTRTGPLNVEKTESVMSTLGNVFQLALTEYRAKGNGKKVLVLRKYGFIKKRVSPKPKE
jgi:hypothetical protein